MGKFSNLRYDRWKNLRGVKDKTHKRDVSSSSCSDCVCSIVVVIWEEIAKLKF